MCAFVRLWVKLETKTLVAAHLSSIALFLAENLSMSYTLYCLFQLYVCTHDMIHEYKSTDKFVAIKAILGIAVLQARERTPIPSSGSALIRFWIRSRF